MRLIGMLDSPYVRRVAISMACLDIPFEHEAVSVISTFEQFQRINPVVKAPTLVCDDGEMLMDSSLILQFIEATSGRSLWPSDATALQRDIRVVGLALAACEKGVQTIYERQLRPASKQHAPWLERVRTQLLAALGALEQAVHARPEGFSQASITAAIAWQFLHSMQPELATPDAYPSLAALSNHMEATALFLRFPPIGPGVQPPGPDASQAKASPPTLGYTIVYVPNVAASLDFFERAFNLQRRFLHESGTYGELDTGSTALAFAAHELGDMNFPGGHVAAHSSDQPLGFEVALVTDDVAGAHAQALAAGATEMASPLQKPWGQTVSYVRCPDGVLVELCTPVG